MIRKHLYRQDSRRFADAYEHGFFLRDANNRTRDELYKNRSSRKRSPGSPILLKILSENRFSGKTYFNSIASRDADQSDSQLSTFNYTIMAAGDAQDDGDGRILYFSTPIDTGRGRGVFGTDRDDNRRKHIETRYNTVETAYKVAICPTGNILYMRIYLIHIIF